MLPKNIGLLCLLLSVSAVVASADDKANFTGQWQLSEAKSSLKSGKPSPVNITIEQKNGASIHVIKTLKEGDKENVVDFTCTTDGKECDAKGLKVSLWYSGPSLVELDTVKDVTTRSTMKLDEAGKILAIDIAHVSPPAEADKLVLDKK